MNPQSYRIEKDLLGEERVSSEAYYGLQTLRATQNFQVTGVPISQFPEFIGALAMVKQACARANTQLGEMSDEKASAIDQACQEIIDGKLHTEFVVDLIQGGAGTSTNMNANEVISNRALELLGHHKGDYDRLHPNNDVNRSQSTNDVYPTAIRLAIAFASTPLIAGVSSLEQSFRDKAVEFELILKMGRTQLQDAVPMTVGQEFSGFAANLGEDILRIREAARLLREVNLGGTAIGTGINTHERYSEIAIAELTAISKIPLTRASNMIEASWDMGVFVYFSGVLKRLSVKLSKISNDLRLLSSGPRAGIGELNLPAMQAGSSIMPRKVNPVIPEAVSQTAYQVIGNDLVVTLAAEAGQLQLNAMEPLIVYNMLQSIRILTNAIEMLEKRCVRGITVNESHCTEQVRNSLGLITALVPHLGYETSTQIAKLAQASNRSVIDVILDQGLLDNDQLVDLLRPENMISPRPDFKPAPLTLES